MIDREILTGEWKVPVQSLIDHIRTAVDVDPWAQDMAAKLLTKQIAKPAEVEGGGSTWFYVCGECHGQIDERDRFCRHCGNKIGWQTTNSNKTGQKFAPQCTKACDKV